MRISPKNRKLINGNMKRRKIIDPRRSACKQNDWRNIEKLVRAQAYIESVTQAYELFLGALLINDYHYY